LKRVVVLDAADEELVEAAKFYESKTKGLGVDFLAELDNAIARLTDHPYAGAVVSGPVRRRLLRRFPYGLLYRLEADEIVIVAVMHLHRRPGYWSGR
jgi:plasmid stabilization system protein ParE